MQNDEELEIIKRIKDKYSEKQSTKRDRLFYLDHKVNSVSLTAALVPGISGMLVFGVGLCCVTVWNLTALGIFTGILGASFMATAWPFYKRTLKKMKTRYGKEIIELSNELL